MYAAAHPLETRRAECTRLCAQYPGMLPVAVEGPQRGSKTHLLALPGTATVADLEAALRDASGVRPEARVLLSVDGCAVPAAATIGELHAQCEGEDGFLHVVGATERAMGVSFSVGIPCFMVGFDVGSIGAPGSC